MAREIVHVGRKIKVAVDTTTAPDGTIVRRDAILHPGAVVILPILDSDHVVLLRNHRFVIGETLWEVPAGTLEPGEPLQTCAERELAEETGYTAANCGGASDISTPRPACSTKLHLFVAESHPRHRPAEPCEELRGHDVPRRSDPHVPLRESRTRRP